MIFESSIGILSFPTRTIFVTEHRICSCPVRPELQIEFITCSLQLFSPYSLPDALNKTKIRNQDSIFFAFPMSTRVCVESHATNATTIAQDAFTTFVTRALLLLKLVRLSDLLQLVLREFNILHILGLGCWRGEGVGWQISRCMEARIQGFRT